MLDAPDEFTIPVDVTNPGQFYACCGLLELATAMRPDEAVTGQFDTDGFRLSVPPAGVIEMLRDGIIEVRPLPENSVRIRGGAAHKVSPMLVRGVLTLDWWLDPSAGGIKTWAGGMSAPLTVAALHEALAEVAADAHPFDDAVVTSAATFCFDCRMGGDAIDLGGADAGIPTMKYPAVDLLAFVGLQRFRPGDVDRRTKTYATWREPLPASLAAAVSTRLIPPLSDQAFRFRMRPRDASFRYKSFGRAEPAAN